MIPILNILNRRDQQRYPIRRPQQSWVQQRDVPEAVTGLHNYEITNEFEKNSRGEHADQIRNDLECVNGEASEAVFKKQTKKNVEKIKQGGREREAIAFYFSVLTLMHLILFFSLEEGANRDGSIEMFSRRRKWLEAPGEVRGMNIKTQLKSLTLEWKKNSFPLR